MDEAARARKVAEESRETRWQGVSFLRELFLGDFRDDILDGLKMHTPRERRFVVFMASLERFLRAHVDPAEIDRTGEVPRDVIAGLADLGAFGLKIPERYGGMGFSHQEYVRVMTLLGGHDANVTALLSAHQAIGVPQPVYLFGTEEQKQTYLPRCARGAISAFALTEPAVGSDPGKLETTATPSADGETYTLRGAKLWCTNGTLAELIVVMARVPSTDRISAFIVEMDSPGVRVAHRCRFMGLKALANAYVILDEVRVPRANIIGGEGNGLRVALATLNTGRLSLPAATAGLAKRCTEIVRKWSNARVQWGQRIGKHEAVAHLNAGIVSSAFAMESVALALGELADRDDTDIRLEAAAGKEWNTRRAWELIDRTLQVRGGRGYETEDSLVGRGEAGIGVERMMRDARVNLIFEGSSEIMHLFMAREAVDKHLEVAGALVDPTVSWSERLRVLPSIAAFYLRWYPTRWFARPGWWRFRSWGPLAPQLRFVARYSRKLARAIFHGMLVHRAALERKQAFLFRAVDIAMELFVIAVTARRARLLSSDPEAGDAYLQLADGVFRDGRRRVRDLVRELWRNDDAQHYRLGRRMLDGDYAFVEEGILALPYTTANLAPATMDELQATEHRQSSTSSSSAAGANPS